MNVRKDDNFGNSFSSDSSSSSSLGIVAAVIGIGVAIGTGIYYFFNKQENPDYEGQQTFRARSSTIEQCSICLNVMFRTEEVTSLSCTHNFHTRCIRMWLQYYERSCPNCRRVVE